MDDPSSLQDLNRVATQLEEVKTEKTWYQMEYQGLLAQVGGVQLNSHHKDQEREEEVNNNEGIVGEGGGKGQLGGGGRGDVSRLNQLLERTERELFEARTQLEAKVILYC